MITNLFTRYAKLLKVMAEPRRLEIIHLLRDQELCVTDIYQMLAFPQPNISQHLTKLKASGIVRTRRQGKHIFYSLKNPQLIKAADLIKSTLSGEKDHSKKVTDPVCKMKLTVDTASFHYRVENSHYYFCGSGCLVKFKKESKLYV